MWLRVNRLQLPLLSSSTYGFFNNSISQNSKNVNTKNNTDKGVENVKYSIDKHFAEIYDKWDKKSTGFAFRVGTTSTVLHKLGVNNKTIYWDATKIKKIKEKYPEMTDSIIKQVPNILENPIIVMESNTVSGRLVLFGDVYDSKNNPVLVALELNPTEKGGKSLNIIKIASAYGKDVDLQGFINKSKILYVEPNKERTHNWLSVNRLKLPLPSTRFGFFNNSISQSENNVNTKNDESSNDIKYSMGGLKAETADKSALEKAMELEKDGTDSEKIRKETGWFKGYDGKWRFEIDNSELEFKTDIEKNRAAAIELAKMKVKSAELEEKIVNDTATKAEENVQTMYSGKNKESLATTPSENKSLSQTSETLSGTASYKILAHEGNKVNIKENDNISDIKYATDDTINDWLDDESTPQGIDYEKAVEKNPVIEEITMQSKEKTSVRTLTGKMLYLLIAVIQCIRRMKI